MNDEEKAYELIRMSDWLCSICDDVHEQVVEKFKKGTRFPYFQRYCATDDKNNHWTILFYCRSKAMKKSKAYGVLAYITYDVPRKRKENYDNADLDNTFNRRDFRKHCYERSGYKCEICGKEVTWKDCELHHVLPFHKFPNLAMDERNMQCLCHSCHKGIHCDPYKEIRQMEEKANELGINLKEYYDIRG